MADRRRHEFKLNIGISSILFIFVILCLVSFAVLSLTTATSDYRLSERALNNSTAYYSACNEAEETLSDLDETLSTLYATGISRSGYFERAGRTKSFTVKVTDIQSLVVEVNILYPDNGGTFYEVTSWKLETTGSLDYDESLPVYK